MTKIYTTTELISKRCLPLSFGMLKRLNFTEDNFICYHLTNTYFLQNLKQNQNTNKHISTFTNFSNELARLPSQPNIIVKLKGTKLIEGKTDIWSYRDNRDKRWLNVSKTYNKYGSDKLEFMMNGIIQKVFNKLNIDINVYKLNDEELKLFLDKYFNKKFYRYFLLYIEKELNLKYNVLYDYLNNDTLSKIKYNEIILDNWYILDVCSIEEGIEKYNLR